MGIAQAPGVVPACGMLYILALNEFSISALQIWQFVKMRTIVYNLKGKYNYFLEATNFVHKFFGFIAGNLCKIWEFKANYNKKCFEQYF